MPNRDCLLQKVSETGFAVTDLQLYLDTHPESRAAHSALKQALKRRCEAICNYEACCGPLTIDSLIRRDEYDWLDTPWPWE